jgi:hypothetical protein
MTFGNETNELNLTNCDYKYDIYNRNLVGRPFGRCLCNRLLLLGCAMRFTNRSVGTPTRPGLHFDLPK